MLQELFSREVALLDALLCKTIYNLCLSSNRSVVCSGHPASVLPVEASFTNQDVLNGVVEHVAHVQHARHVWWRNDTRVGFTAVGLAREELMLHPVLVPFSLDFSGTIFCC